MALCYDRLKFSLNFSMIRDEDGFFIKYFNDRFLCNCKVLIVELELDARMTWKELK